MWPLGWAISSVSETPLVCVRTHRARPDKGVQDGPLGLSDKKNPDTSALRGVKFG